MIALIDSLKLTMLPSHLTLRNNELQRIAVVRLVDRVIQDADGFQQTACWSHFFREIRWVCNNHPALCLELHGLTIPIFHGRFDAADFARFIIQHLLHMGI